MMKINDVNNIDSFRLANKRALNKFKPGYHTIAVKAIDHEGLEAIEINKLEINGEITIS